MPGIPVLDIDKGNFENKFLCEYCGSLPRDAMGAGCGHFFCSSCVENRFQKNPGGVSYCPKTMRPLFYYEFSPADDQFCDELHDLKVHCLFLTAGCPWIGKLQKFEDHVGICDFASSCHKKEMKQLNESGNSKTHDCSSTEVKSKPMYNEESMPEASVMDHVGICDFASSCHKKEMKQLNESGNSKTHDCSSTEVKSKPMYNEESTPEASVMTLSNDVLKVSCVYPDCGMLVADLFEHLTGNECVASQQLGKCRFCKVQLDPGSVIELHYNECPAFPVVLGKCGKDGDHQGRKEELNNTLPLFPLSRKLNLMPSFNEADVMEQIMQPVKELTPGNAAIQSAWSYYSHEQRLNNIESKLAQHDLLFEENIRLKRDVERLTSAFLDLKHKVDRIEQGLANALQSIDYDNLLGSLNSLNIEQINLKAQLSRLLENLISREEQVRLIRYMEAIEERIRRLEQHLLSHRNMLSNMSTSVRSLANVVASDRGPGVDIQTV